MSDSIFGIHGQALVFQSQRMGILASNIANADNTLGYSRERVNLASMQAQYQNGSYIGSGVQVASLNGEISKAQATNPNALPNDLLDQRDQLITQISSLIDVKANSDNFLLPWFLRRA